MQNYEKTYPRPQPANDSLTTAKIYQYLLEYNKINNKQTTYGLNAQTSTPIHKLRLWSTEYYNGILLMDNVLS